VLRVAASVERGSEHPLAAAIVKAAQERGLALAEGQDFQAISGKGVVGTVDARRVALGNAVFLRDQGIAVDSALPQADARKQAGETVLLVAIDGKPAGVLSVADTIRATTPEALQQSRTEGMRIVMLTGDSRATAEAVARTLGINEVIAEVLPSAK